jgi:chromosomal replication initiation ATPase DnaA
VKQYSLKFPVADKYLIQDYVVTEANHLAYEVLINHAMPWGILPYPHHLLLVGPKSSGKTYLAHICGQDFIDDIETFDEEELLHTFNQANEESKPLLMTASALPKFSLPDLRSRVNSVRTLYLGLPDEQMIVVLLTRHFSARSLKVSGEVIDYLATRLERDFDSIRLFVERLDAYALETKRDITVPLVRKMLELSYRA